MKVLAEGADSVCNLYLPAAPAAADSFADLHKRRILQQLELEAEGQAVATTLSALGSAFFHKLCWWISVPIGWAYLPLFSITLHSLWYNSDIAAQRLHTLFQFSTIREWRVPFKELRQLSLRVRYCKLQQALKLLPSRVKRSKPKLRCVMLPKLQLPALAWIVAAVKGRSLPS